MATSFHAISPDHPCITIATKKEEREKESKETRRSDTKVFLRSKKRVRSTALPTNGRVQTETKAP